MPNAHAHWPVPVPAARPHLQLALTQARPPHPQPPTAPLQVEAALCQHPGVAAAAVVGVPDARMGERVAAVVVVRPGWAWQGHVVRAGPEHMVQQQPQQQQQQATLVMGLEQQQQHKHLEQQEAQAHGAGGAQGLGGPHGPAAAGTLTADGLCHFCRVGQWAGEGALGGGGRAGAGVEGVLQLAPPVLQSPAAPAAPTGYAPSTRTPQLSPYKLPRLVAATWPLGAPLPCNASGKVVKAHVRSLLLPLAGALAEHGAGAGGVGGGVGAGGTGEAGVRSRM